MDTGAAVCRIYDEVVGPMDRDRAAELVHPGCRTVTPLGTLRGPRGLLMWVATLKVAFPDLVARPVGIMAGPAHARWDIAAEGTHLEEFFGLAPTLQVVRLTGPESAAFAADGRVLEWVSEVGLVDAMLQLGAIPELAAPVS